MQGHGRGVYKQLPVSRHLRAGGFREQEREASEEERRSACSSLQQQRHQHLLAPAPAGRPRSRQSLPSTCASAWQHPRISCVAVSVYSLRPMCPQHRFAPHPCVTCSFCVTQVFPSAPSDLGGLVGALEGALRRRQLRQGEVLLAAGAAVRHAFIIEEGAVVEEEHFEGGVRVG